MLILGGHKSWKVRRHGEIAVSFQWVNGEGAMCIYNPARKGSTAVVICLSAAHKYADSTTGGPTPFLAEASIKYAEMLGSNHYKVASVIADSLADLLDMPPEPDWSGRAPTEIGEVVLFSDGKEVATRPVTDAEMRIQ